jgi:multidomain signaling protein FimX
VMQNDIIRLIVIDESDSDAEVILNRLRKARYAIRPHYVEDDEDLQEALTEHEWDLIISVPEVGDLSVDQVCEMVSSSKQDIPVIVLVKKLDSKSMAKLLSIGAKQVIWYNDNGCLPVVVGRELNNLTERRKRKHLEQLYKESQKHNKMLLETSRDAIAYVHDGMHIHANPSYLKMFSYKSMEDIEGLPIMDLISLDDQAKFKDFMREFMEDDKEEERQIDLEGLKSNKKRFKLKMEFSQAIYDSERCIQVIIRDQSQNQALEQKLKEVSRRDQLTGLLNRQYFLELLEKALAKAMETHTRSVLFYIVLDNFAKIREQVGVAGVDPVIKNIAQVINRLSEGGSLARFGESTFVLLLADKDGKQYAAAGDRADKICKLIAESVTELEDQSVVTTCSIGITQVLAASPTPQDVLTDAYATCKIAIDNGGNRYELFKPRQSTEQDSMTGSDMAKLIERAIEENRLSLRYQPIVSLQDETNEIYELFLRMVDEEGENVPVGKLFDAAEQANLGMLLDKWVLEEATKVLVKQHKSGHETYFFIKLSDQAIQDENVLLHIRKLLKSAQLPGERLILEISESIAIGQIKLAKAFINQLKMFGCKTALEHFGTGLNYATTLKHIDVDYVKIDAQYSKELANNSENQQTVQNIVKMAHESGKLTIAEAVEEANSLTVLWSSEVDYAQGHYIQEPLEEPDFDFSDEE